MLHTTYIEQVVSKEAFFWGDDVSESYHETAAREMDIQWNSYVAPALEILKPNLDVTIDFACGFGRNAKKLLTIRTKKIVFVDVNRENVEKFGKLFLGDDFRFIINNGFDLKEIRTSSAFFSIHLM